VAVEISTRVPRASASAMAGAQYASDLPTPVPAWMTAMARVGKKCLLKKFVAVQHFSLAI
jgi:hypothetical protein